MLIGFELYPRWVPLLVTKLRTYITASYTYPLFPGGFAQQGKTDFSTCVLQNIPKL